MKTVIRDGYKIPEGHRIALFKKGSRGEIVGWYDSIVDIVQSEKMFHPNFHSMSVYNSLKGAKRGFTSYNHQCRVVAKIIPYVKNKTSPEAA